MAEERPLRLLSERELVARIKSGGISDSLIEYHCGAKGIDSQAARQGYVRYRHLIPYFASTAKSVGQAVAEGTEVREQVIMMMNTLTNAGFDLESAKRGELVDLCKE